MADWNSIIDTVTKAGKSAADVYNAWTGNDNDGAEETAYLKGQLAAMEATQKAQIDSDTIRIGDASISTGSLMWIIGEIGRAHV